MTSTSITEVTNMPCQCGSTTTADVDTTPSGCGCETESGTGCGCGSGPAASERDTKLERVVMELDKRLRKLEGRI